VLVTLGQTDGGGSVDAAAGHRPGAIESPPSSSSDAATSEDTVEASRPTVAAARARIAEQGAPELWRSLDELAAAPEFRAMVDNEFPRYAPSEWEDGASRRDFLKLAGASVSLAGLAACTRQPPERLVPYVEQPESIVPGKPTFYATSMTLSGFGVPLVAESQMGRPTKLAGNAAHPAIGGGSDVLSQAATLCLYDPDRSKRIERRGRPLGWSSFVGEMQPQLQAWRALGGEGLRVLTGTVTSPTLRAQLDRLIASLPKARWVQYEPINDDAAVAAAREAFGTDVETTYDLSRAEIIVALDADFLTHGPAHLRHARDFAAKRQLRGGKRTMNRLYAVESTVTATGASADHRVAATPAQVGAFAAALASALGAASGAPGALSDSQQRVLAALVDDLRAHQGRCAVIPGRFAPAEVHVLAHAINAALGNVGSTVRYVEPVGVPTLQADGLRELVSEMVAGQVDALFVLGVNPVYDAPGDVEFATALANVDLSVHLGSHQDETGLLTTWHIPQSHFLEGWGDVRAFDGTASIVQPLIEPLYQSKTELELLSVLVGENRSDYELVQEYWLGAGGLDTGGWRRAVHDGFVAGSAAAEVAVVVSGTAASAAAARLATGSAATASGTTLVLRPDPCLYDGRFANNGWLQELPKPLTKVTWDQVALLSPATAEELGVEAEQLLRITVGERSVEAPAWIQPGQASGTVALSLGFGRTAAGRVGNGVGQNSQKLRALGGGWSIDAVTVAKTGQTRTVATTQTHHNLDTQTDQAAKRHLIKHGTLAELQADPNFPAHQGHHVPDVKLFDDWKYQEQDHAWGMAVDLTSCTGCNACVVACVAENNIPVVGREQIINGREMHWLRIDRYYAGDLDAPNVHHQPVMCQHCERAPCELVCPVGATTHSDEGLNDMTYNRCIGTRYCSNNCPYKVRRFNFLRFNDTQTPVLRMARNPNVSVRVRGVMEKCTYCVQRINLARIDAKREDRKIRDGEVKTACQEACPSHAISFGNINDPQSEVTRWKAEPFNYLLLEELATAPRTTYLARINNPNPALHSGNGAHPGDSAAHAEGEQH
jgi:molybdopterin-containing oxidoreductase family iron-sulfur binding subunit